MDLDEGPPIVAALVERVREGRQARHVACAVATIWRRVDTSLHQIIGPDGVAALYKRSLLLTSRSHPWLAEMCAEGRKAVEVAAFMTALAEKDPDDAARGGGEFLERFYALLSGLIGRDLSRRLLPFMWDSLE